MEKLSQQTCSEFILLNFSQGKCSLQEVILAQIINPYSKQNIDTLDYLNCKNKNNNQEKYSYQLKNEINLTEDMHNLFLKILKLTQYLNNLYQNKFFVLQNLALNLDDPEFDLDIQAAPNIKAKNNILQDQNDQVSKQIVLMNSMKQEDIDPKIQVNLQNLKSILNCYENFIMNKLDEISFEIVIMNPFKLNFSQLQNIFLDTLSAIFVISTPCRKKDYNIKSNIQDLQVLKQNVPSVQIEIFQLQLTIFGRFNHCYSDILDQETCQICDDDPQLYEQQRAGINLNSFFTDIKSFKINLTGEDVDSFLNWNEIDLNFNYKKDEIKIYSKYDIFELEAFGAEQKTNILNFKNEENDFCIDFQTDLIRTDNLLTNDYLYVNKYYQKIVEQQDLSLLKLIILDILEFNQILNSSYQKIVVDLYDD
ncbi:hypothetical protein ABPG74_019743 [Tetrahymena malaccensis]